MEVDTNNTSRCFINPSLKTLLYEHCPIKKIYKQYDLKSNKLSVDDLSLIARCNREFLCYLGNNGNLDKINLDGCLPLKCLNLINLDSNNNNNNNNNNNINNINKDEENKQTTTVSPKYIKNL